MPDGTDDASDSAAYSAADRWVRDDLGRVGRLMTSRDGGPPRVKYASGEQRLRRTTVEMLNHSAARYEFAKQRDFCWAACCEHDEMSRRILRRVSRLQPGTVRFEELAQDVGVETMRRASLVWDAKRGVSLRGYLSHCLTKAYRKALGGRRSTDRVLDEAGELDARSSGPIIAGSVDSYINGLDARERLSSIVQEAGLTPEELGLLLARYDGTSTLRELADELGVASPQTVLNAVNRLIARCRNAI